MNLNDPITCAWCQDHMESYLDGELTDEVSLCLNGHLLTCNGCTRELELAGRIRTSLQDMLLPEVPKKVTDSVFDQIRTEQRKQRKSLRPSWGRSTWGPLALAAMADTAILFGTRLMQVREPPVAVVSVEELALAVS